MSGGEIVLWELLGTGMLLLIGVGVCANLTLRGLPGNGGGWLMGSITWGFAVFIGASIAAPTGGHLNPAVSLAQAMRGAIDWADLPWYLLGQFAGASAGALLAYLAYKVHFDAHDDHTGTLGVFATRPAIRKPAWNVVTEVIATFVLVTYILLAPGISGTLQAGDVNLGNAALGYAGVAFVIIAIGNGLGGPTGYALNPARDLGPRLVYTLLPIRGKGSPEWSYAWVPLMGPLIGAVLAALLAGAML